MRRATPLLYLLSLLLCLPGCKIQGNQAAYKPRPQVYRKIVSLSPGTTEILTSGLAQYSLAGRTASDNWPSGSIDRIPIVASLKPDYEKLARLRPDLIVYDASLYNEQDVAKLKSLGAALFKIDANDLDTFEKQVFELGALVAGETYASTYVDKIYIALNAAQAKPPQPTPKVAVMMPSVSGDHMIAGTGSFVADIVRKVGGEPVGPSGSLFVKANPETLVTLNPDVIIVNGSKGDVAGAVALSKDPRLQSVKAIKNGRIRAIESDVLLRRGGRVDLLISGIMRALAAPAK